MTDEELQEIAGGYPDLTEMVRKALKDEMDRRGLSIVSEEVPPAVSDVEPLNLVTIRTFKILGEAIIAKGALEAGGIESFLFDQYGQLVEDGMREMNLTWFPSVVWDTIKLQVRREEAEAAIEILDQPIPNEPEDEE